MNVILVHFREKMTLEQDRAQKEADIKIRTVEVQTLQKELDAINTTLKQLETQKGEAQKRLDDLDDKVGVGHEIEISQEYFISFHLLCLLWWPLR